MHIFIDESGSFPVGASGISPSLVGALIIPEHKIHKLFAKYDKIRAGLRKYRGEVKGKFLAESDVARVLALLRKNSCIFEAVGVDMALETAQGLEEHRRRQAEALTGGLTPQHQPTLVAAVNELRARLEAMPLPLYVQSQLTIRLLGNIIQILPTYWALRLPKETLNYHWVIDGKEVGRVTNAEDWWSSTMLGLMQTRSFRDPMRTPDWVDMTAFHDKFRMDVPEWLLKHVPGEKDVVDLKLLMKE